MRLLSSFIILLIITASAFSQEECFDLIFSSQAEIDAFPLDFPDCKTVEGSVLISGEDVVNLEPLSQLENIRFEIFIESTGIKNLNGLDSLKTIGFGIFIFHNQELESIDVLNGLESFNGFLNIGFNEQLKSIDGFNNLKIMTGDLFFESLPALDTISGFNNLVGIQGHFIINGCGSKSLSVTGFDKFRTFSGGVFEIGFSAMEEFSGFDNLTKVVGEFSIIDNMNLKKIDAFQNLEFCTNLRMSFNNELEAIDGFNRLGRVEDLTIGFNNELKAISGFSKLERARTISISTNDNLIELSGFESLTEIEALYIEQNDSLEFLSSFESLKRIREFFVTDNDNLNYINGFTKLETVDSSLVIGDNVSLEKIFDYEPTIFVGRDLMISGNYHLTSLQSLSNLKIDNLSSLVIAGNEHLSECSIDNICRHLRDLQGTFNLFSSNASRCNSSDEVLANCSFTSTTQLGSETSYIYPNPTDGLLHLDLKSIENVSVMDIYGNTVLSEDQVTESVDISSCDSGIYFLTIQSKGETYTQKIIKN